MKYHYDNEELENVCCINIYIVAFQIKYIIDIQTRQVPTGLENENETQDAQHTPEAPRITFPLWCVGSI